MDGLDPKFTVFLRQLPIFATFAGTYSPLTAGVFLPPLEIFSRELCKGLPEFLDFPSEYNHFAKKLQVKEKDPLEFFVDFIIPKLKSLPLNLRNQALLALLQSANFSDYEYVLTNTAFVPNCKGTLLAPNKLYDPSIVLLKDLLPEEEFPCAPFDSEWCLARFHSLGLQRALSKEKLVSLCANVSSCIISLLLFSLIRLRYHPLISRRISSNTAMNTT